MAAAVGVIKGATEAFLGIGGVNHIQTKITNPIDTDAKFFLDKLLKVKSTVSIKERETVDLNV